MLFQEATETDIVAVIREADQFVLTAHARRRMAQRNVSLADVHFVLKHGKVLRRAGAIFVHLRKRDIPEEKRGDQNIARLEGTTVLLSKQTKFAYAISEQKDGSAKSVIVESPVVITVWRNRQRGLRHIQLKPPYDRPRRFR